MEEIEPLRVYICNLALVCVVGIQKLFDLKVRERKMFEVNAILMVLGGVWLLNCDSMTKMGWRWHWGRNATTTVVGRGQHHHGAGGTLIGTANDGGDGGW